MISKIENKDKIALVVVGYNRINSLKRLLISLEAAQYPTSDIPLIISIDCSENKELYSYVEQFVWTHGTKYVNIQKTRLGLIKHIYQCGDLTKLFKAVVLLEDDLFVSPYFYDYVLETVEKYGDNTQIAEISLYKSETNGYVGLPFATLQDGNDVLLMQDVSTWGQCWTEQMWNGFIDWRDSHSDRDVESTDMPGEIKKWDRAWSKYYNAYVVNSCKYVLYPNISLTTNFSDAGEHGGTNNSAVQVSILQGKKKYILKELSELTKYDIYGNNVRITEWLGMKPEEVCLDVYGIHSPSDDFLYILSTKAYPYKVIRSFALNLRPIELNVKYNVKGKGLFLYEIGKINSKNVYHYAKEVVPYFLKGFNNIELYFYIKEWLFDFIRCKFKKICSKRY